MYELTRNDLDMELAEQLPARELMGGCAHRSGNYSDGGSNYHNGSSTQNTAVAGNSSSGFINVANGNQVQILTFGSSNGNAASAG